MADENHNKQEKKSAILIYQLPAKDKTDVLAGFPHQYIEKAFHDSNGLQIYFKNYDFVRQTLLKRTFKVKGRPYNVYPMVTNLTVRDIGAYAEHPDIKKAVKCYGCVLDLYPVLEITGNRNRETRSLTSDYRIILDVPEVFTNFHLTPVKLPDTDIPFEVLFFCRLCRRNGHKQFQCPDPNEETYSDHCNRKHYRSVSYESSSSDTTLCENTVKDCKTNSYLDPLLSRNCRPYLKSVKAEPKNDYGENKKLNSCKQQKSTSSQNSNSYWKSIKAEPKDNYGEDDKCNSCERKPSRRLRNSNPHWKSIKAEPKDNNGENKKFKSCEQQTYSRYTAALGSSKFQHDSDTSVTSDYFDDRKEFNGSDGIHIENCSDGRFQFESYKLSQGYYPDPSPSKSNHRNMYHHSMYVKDYNFDGHIDNSELLKRKKENTSKRLYGINDESALQKSSSNLVDNKYLDLNADHEDARRKETGSSMESELGNKTEKTGKRPRESSASASERVCSVLSSILPQDADISESRKYLFRAMRADPENVAEDVVEEMRKILKDSERTNKKKHGTVARKLLIWIRRFLEKVEETGRNTQTGFHQENSAAAEEASNTFQIHSRRQRNVTLSKGVMEAIFKTSGVLEPELLCNFLNQVRGRKKLLEIAFIFTKKIPALAQQLLEVEHTYFLHQTRGQEEDRDINYIKRLRQRLLTRTSNLEAASTATETDIFMRQSTGCHPPDNN